MNDLWAEMKKNLREMARMFSTWVASIAGFAAMYWLGLSHEEQLAIASAIPYFKVSAPLIGMVIYLIAKALPQDIDKK